MGFVEIECWLIGHMLYYASLTSCGLELGTRFTRPRASRSSLTVVTYHVTEPSKFPFTSFSTARDKFINVISFCARKTVKMASQIISYFSLLMLTPCFFSGWSVRITSFIQASSLVGMQFYSQPRTSVGLILIAVEYSLLNPSGFIFKSATPVLYFLLYAG